VRAVTLLIAGLAAGCASAAQAQTFEQTGSASWYGAGHQGKTTASGERFDMRKLTAAHPKLPLGSVLEVTNLANDRSVRLRVNDRGPFKSTRILDVSREAADQLGFLSQGTTKVRIRLVGKQEPQLRPKLAAGPGPEAESETVEPADAPAPGEGAPTFVVQVGVFAVRANAERAADRLVDIGAVAVSEARAGGRALHSVSLRGWPDRAGAEAARAAVAKAGFADARIVNAD